MLSQGIWHKQVPRDLAGNLRFRVKLLESIRSRPEAVQGVVEMCRKDILFFLTVFAWCYNPKLPPKHRVLPFIPWDFQENMVLEILECVEQQKPGVCEKSRELGASWLFLFVEDWLARFHAYTQILNISRDADSVDCKSPDSLFWKLRFINEHLPSFLPKKTEELKMYHAYENGSVITGEASTGYAGVSGRASMILLDEFSKVKDDTAMRQSTAGTADCRFFVSTHEGEGTEFWRITREAEFRKWTLHWTQHPMKNQGLYSYEREPTDGKPPGLRYWKYNTETSKIEPSAPHEYAGDYPFVTDGSPTGGPYPGIRSPWYDAMCLRIGDSRGVAMELDVDPISSVKTLFEPIVIRSLQSKCVPPYWEGDVIYEQDGANPRLVPGLNGPLKLWTQLVGQGAPTPGTYKLGADVSGGTGCTPSCVTIGDAEKGRKVGEYANPRIDPKEFGTLLSALGHIFRDEAGSPAEVSWENRGPGVTCGEQLALLQYPKRHVARSRDKVGQPLAGRYGFNPENDGKAKMLRDYRFALVNHLFYNPSKLALEETLKFVYDQQGKIIHTGAMDSKDPSGARENHGDRATADGICNMLIRDSGLGKEIAQVEEVPRATYWYQTLEGRRQMAERNESMGQRWA